MFNRLVGVSFADSSDGTKKINLFLIMMMHFQENKAIVVDEPGVTRDRLYGRSYWGNQEFVVVDTGGVMTVSKSPSGVMEELNVSTTIGMEGIPLSSREAAVARMPSMIEKQATAAVEESAVIVFVVDGQVRCLSSISFTFLSLAFFLLGFSFPATKQSPEKTAIKRKINSLLCELDVDDISCRFFMFTGRL